jgi:aspartokinase
VRLRSLLWRASVEWWLKTSTKSQGLPAQVFSALVGIEVWLALTSASRRSLSLVTSERDVPEVVQRLHHSLLEDNRPKLESGAEESVVSAVSA